MTTIKTILFLASSYIMTVYAADPDWNYDNAGNDWTMDLCDQTTPGRTESPANLQYSLMTTHSDWQQYKFSFLPYFRAAEATSYGPEDYVYKIKGDSFGLLTAAEPYTYSIGDYKVTWEVSEVRFHYPAEHTVNGTAYDLEMQLFFTTTSNTLLCSSKQGALSVFFTIDDTAATNTFFDWQTDATAGNPITVDLNKAVKNISAMTQYIYGYIGSDTMPPCTQRLCWYHLMDTQTISTDQFNFFNVEGVTSNAREADLTAYIFGFVYNTPQFPSST